MKFTPYNYQKYAIDRVLKQPRVGLFLDMGLGKTVITLTAIEELIYNRFEISKVLIIAPLRVAQTTWREETEKWQHLKKLRVSLVLGSQAQRLAGLRAPADVYVINRENVPWLCEVLGDRWCFDMVVIDELSSFKSPKAARFKALKRQIVKCSRVVGLTGTPAPNGLLDLWSQVVLLDFGERLGRTFGRYRDTFFEPDKRSSQMIYTYRPREGARASVLKRLEDLCVSMRASDYLELPPRFDRTVRVQLAPRLLAGYEKFERDSYMETAEGGVSALGAGALINKLLQYSNGAVYNEDRSVVAVHDAKLDALGELVEAAAGQPLLCFYSYQHDAARIMERFPMARKLQTPEDIRAWNAGAVPLLLCHPASAGHGLNLQSGGHLIVWFGLCWSLELYQQANARLHRQGQTEPVIVHHLICDGTADWLVFKSLSNKEDVQSSVLAALRVKLLKGA